MDYVRPVLKIMLMNYLTDLFSTLFLVKSTGMLRLVTILNYILFMFKEKHPRVYEIICEKNNLIDWGGMELARLVGYVTNMIIIVKHISNDKHKDK